MRLIDATALTEQIQKLSHNEYMVNWLGVLIDTQPTVKVEPIEVPKPVRHGKWIYGNDFHWYTASCSACGYQRRTDIKVTGWNQWKYCPNCGAKMDEE